MKLFGLFLFQYASCIHIYVYVLLRMIIVKWIYNQVAFVYKSTQYLKFI